MNDLLASLSNACGISSMEDGPEQVLEHAFIPYADRVYRDGIGSLIAVQNQDAPGPKIMVATHMDEVGFMIKKIDENGYLRLQPLGSMWTHVLAGQMFTVVTESNKKYHGIIGTPASHGLPAEIRSHTLAMDDLYLDMGVSCKDEIEQAGIQIGDMAVPAVTLEPMINPDTVTGKALDNRAGCMVAALLMEKLYKQEHSPLYAAATVQEEPGLRGARTAADIIHPDLSFAVDTTVAGDTPVNTNSCKLGGGVVLSMIDSNTIAHRGLIRYAEQVCERENIPYQYAVFKKGGTDSGNIHKSFEGVVSMSLSIPIRYMHTAHSIINIKDIDACVRLIECIAKEMSPELYERLVNEEEDFA